MSRELVTDGSVKLPKPRKRWSEAQKRQLVALSYQPGISVSKLARQYNVNANQLFNWRRTMREASAESRTAAPFALIDVALEAQPESRGSVGGQIEIELAGGARVRVDAGVNEAALVRVLSAVKVAV